MKVLDLFCGLGGWSDGFHQLGFDVTGVDIVNVGYPYRLILKDITTLDGRDFKDQFDVIVGSPPCRDFSKMTAVSRIRNWRDPPNIERGLRLVRIFLSLVDQIKPRFWVMENVPGLCKYLEEPPRCTIKMMPTMRRCLWGNFPAFLVPMELGKPKREMIGGSLRSWLRAKIPLCVSLALAQAILNELSNSNQKEVKESVQRG